MKNIILLLFGLIHFSVSAQNWEWARTATDSESNIGSSTATDADGNIYVTGHFYLPTITFGSFTLTNDHTLPVHGLHSSPNIFLVKYNSAGTVLWAVSAGEEGYDQSLSITTDPSGNVFITGHFSEKIIFGSDTLTNTDNGYRVFLAKYDPNGNPVWAKASGGMGLRGNWGQALITDSAGNIYLTGCFASPAIMFGTFSLTNPSGGEHNTFTVKYDASGNVLWAKSGKGNTNVYDIAVDHTGSVIIAGGYFSSTLEFSPITLTSNESDTYYSNLFLAKYDVNGNIVWAKTEGGDHAIATCLSVDIYGDIYVGGWFSRSGFTMGADSLVYEGSSDILYAKYDNSGNVLWVKSVGTIYPEQINDMIIDPLGKIVLCGVFSSASVSFDAFILNNVSASHEDVFLVTSDENGNFNSAGSAGGTYRDYVLSVAGDAAGNYYLTGYSLSLEVNFGVHNLSFINTPGMFIAKYSPLTAGILAANDPAEINIMPNPSSGIFTVDIKNSSAETNICVYDVLGNCVLDRLSVKGLQQIDLGTQAKGIYFLEILSEEQKVMKKIVLN